MKRACLTIIAILLLLVPTWAYGPQTIYIPAVENPPEACGDRISQMGYWSFIRPTGTTNYIYNPSFERAITPWGNYSTGAAGGTRTRVATQQKFGAYSLQLFKNAGANADRWGVNDQIALTSVLNQDYIASAWFYMASAGSAILYIEKQVGVGVQQTQSVTVTGPTDGWVYVETPVLTANANGDNLLINVWVEGAPNVTGYVDAIQYEVRSTTTTYCDGDQDGCEWIGTDHNSMSRRSAESRAGGVPVDFADMEFDIQGMIGSGMSPITLNADSYALLPGGELNSQKTNIRPFSLTGWIRGTSLADLHAKRQALIDEFKPNAHPGLQPVILRYTGAEVVKEISAYYETGLEGRIRADFECLEQNVALRFLATDPNFYQIGESGSALDSRDTDANRRDVAGRERATGQWSTLGPPNAAGVYNAVGAVAIGPDRYTYYGGNFTNFDNDPNADYLVRYEPDLATWRQVGGGLGNIVNGIAFAPNGDLYVCGRFLNAGGVANADYIAYWDGANWNAVGNPNVGAAVINDIYKMVFDRAGNLYITGNFTNLANIANADYVAMWDGANWNAVGAPAAGAAVITLCDPLAIDSQGNVYVGGVFTTFANVAGADYIAMWDGTNWNAVVQLNAFTSAFAMSADDILYLSGNFTNAGGEANADGIAAWNGISMTALGTGLSTGANTLVFAPDGLLYASGGFTTAGGLTVPGVALWNGASWAHLDFTFTGGLVTEMTVGFADPVVPRNYDLWLGFSTTGTLTYAGAATITNSGTEAAYPRIQVYRSGGTSATLYSVRNESTGKVLWFVYSLLDGERLTIDLRPTQKSIVSSFFGPRPDAVLPNSDFGTWALQPGDNVVTCFVEVTGGPTVETDIAWRDTYWSMD